MIMFEMKKSLDHFLQGWLVDFQRHKINLFEHKEEPLWHLFDIWKIL
jgi:hypothetical protein